jgi:CII protein
MPGLSEAQAKRSRKNLALVLQRLRSVGQVHLAEAVGVSESTISRRVSEDQLQEFCNWLAVLDLKITPAGLRYYDPKQLEPLLELARQRMEDLRSVDQLQFDDTDIHMERGR